MLRLPNRGRYAVTALLDVAVFGGARPSQTKEIAARQRIPLRFLEQIFQDLSRAGLVVGKRGPGGGFVLARPASEVRVGDVLRATCGPLELGAGQGAGRRSELCRVTDAALRDAGKRLEQVFDDLTLEDLKERGRKEGLLVARERVRYAI